MADEALAIACGNCAWWREVPVQTPTIGAPKRGYCYGAPPIAWPQYNSRGEEIGLRNMRPATAENEFCGLFTPLQAVGLDAPVPAKPAPLQKPTLTTVK